MTTADRLADALEAAGAPAVMIERARVGYYDDFKSPLATPITALVGDARAAGLHDIANRAMNGDFDCTFAESTEWEHSPAGQAVLSEFRKP